ncbi:MAG: KTSC domain-containing protein [Rhodanobacter denitrificans]|uniref:KTSC domain-containing protein n=1 Tax=Rhodanobacter denitrificans TaxID=666685 RepID=A0A2W5K5B3_9GAMM|nr:MAG: KTSC domain-containing protein [Rhodanobacter denitrificans]
MKRQSVQSSSIAEIGYAPASRVLEIMFRNGGVYRYFKVSPQAYRALIEAESIGRHLNARIKGRYAYRRVAPALRRTHDSGTRASRRR